MGLILNGHTRRLARAMNMLGLQSVNRLARWAITRVTSDSLTVCVEGLSVTGGLDSWTILSQLADGTFESFERTLYLDAIAPGMTIVDVGANLGVYAMLAAQRVGARGAVYALEPHPGTFQRLKRNVEANGLENVRLFEAAASDRSGTTRLFLSRTATHSGLSRTMDEANPRSVEVQLVTVDELDLGAVDVVKLDVEGEEPRVLEGMRHTLRRSPHASVFLEFSSRALQASGAEPQAFLRSLRELFTEVLVVDEHLETARPAGDLAPRSRTNLLCRGPRPVD